MKQLRHFISLRSRVWLATVLCTLCVACSSHKEVVSHHSGSIDSVAVGSSSLVSLSADTLLRLRSLDIDSLQVCVERQVADTTERIVISAPRVTLNDGSRRYVSALATYEVRDTTAFKMAHSEQSSENKHSVAVADVGSSAFNGFWLLASFALLVLAFCIIKRHL